MTKLVTCCLLLIGIFMTSESKADADATYLIDQSKITETLAVYAYRWDQKDAPGFAELFTEDAVMERRVNDVLIESSVVTGKDNILRYATAAHKGRLAERQTRHHFSNIVFVEIGNEEAVTENMALITHKLPGEPPFITATGVYRIVWKRTADSWLIAHRVLHSDP